ncbi:MAG: competence protein ComEA [Frankiales bacterium]|nr:competence protein ComEA [Frankiales bacterium]
MFRLASRQRLTPEEVAAVHARLATLGFTPSDGEPVVTGGWVPDSTPSSDDASQPQHSPPARPTVAGLLERITVRPAAAVGLVAIAIIGVVIAAVIAWNARARPVTSVAPPAFAAPSASPRAAAVVVVDVAGKVRRPGLVTLPTGSRVADALRAAGGVKPGTDLTSLNLARKLVDGEQIVVGTPASAALAPSTAAGSTTGGVVDLNAATVADFDTLPGIGPVLAQRIVDWRTTHGGFTDVTQLRQVSGIGESKYAQLKDLVRV